MPIEETCNHILKAYKSLCIWIENNQSKLKNLDQLPPLLFEDPDHRLIQECKKSNEYLTFVCGIKKIDSIDKKFDKKIKFLNTEIKLKEDYLMYQFIHQILWQKDTQDNILNKFLKFFSSEQYKIILKYKIENISYTTFTLHIDEFLEIYFENHKDCYITIKLKDKIWKNNIPCPSKLHISNIIEYVSICFELLTLNKIFFNMVEMKLPRLVNLTTEFSAVETVYSNDKTIELNSIQINKFKEFWNILFHNYNDHSHALSLLRDINSVFKSYADNFLYLIYCLEALLGLGDKDSLAFKISYRTAKLNTKDPATQIKIRRDLKKFYDDRSNFVHEGKDEITSEKTTKLRNHIIPVFRNKILINKYWTAFQIHDIIKQHYNYNKEEDIKKKAIEAIIDFLHPLEHEEIRDYEQLF